MIWTILQEFCNFPSYLYFLSTFYSSLSFDYFYSIPFSPLAAWEYFVFLSLTFNQLILDFLLQNSSSTLCASFKRAFSCFYLSQSLCPPFFYMASTLFGSSLFPLFQFFFVPFSIWWTYTCNISSSVSPCTSLIHSLLCSTFYHIHTFLPFCTTCLKNESSFCSISLWFSIQNNHWVMCCLPKKMFYFCCIILDHPFYWAKKSTQPFLYNAFSFSIVSPGIDFTFELYIPRKLLSCLLLPPFFSSLFFISLKSPQSPTLVPTLICLLPFSISHCLCLSFAVILECTKIT